MDIILATTNTSLEEILSRQLQQVNLGLVAGKIATYNFDWRYITLVLLAGVNSYALQSFLQHYDKTVILTDHTYNFNWEHFVSHYILFGHETSDLSTLIASIGRSQLNIDAKYIIVCTSNSNCDEQQIYQSLNQLKVQDFTLLKTTNDSNRVQLSRSEFNFAENCYRAVVKNAILNVHCENDACFKSLYVAHNINMHQCPFVVSTFHNPPIMDLSDRKNPRGEDGALLNLLGEFMNATMEVNESSDETCGNFVNKWSGALGELINHRANATICRNFKNQYFHNFRTSVPYSYNAMVWLARKPKKLPPWMKVLRPLQFKVRIGIFLLFVVLLAINLLAVSKTLKNAGIHFGINILERNLFLNSLLILLGLPIRRITKKASDLFIIYAWVWFCFVMRNSYQAGLLTSLISHPLEDKLNSIQEAYEQGRQFGGAPDMKEYYRDEPDIYDNWIDLNRSGIDNTIRAIRHGRSDFILALNMDSVAYYYTQRKINRNGYYLDQQIAHTPRVLYFRDITLWAKSAEQILLIVDESGIFRKRKDILARRFQKLIEIRRATDDDSPKTLDYEHYKGVFSVIFAGWALSLLTFLCEVIGDKLDRYFYQNL